MRSINLSAAFADVTDYWSPKVVGRVNDQYVKIAKVKGEFVWHKHDLEDELFHVLEGELRIEFEDGSVTLRAGEMFVVPRSKLHKPVAVQECRILLVEPVETKHTGDVESPLTKSIQAQLG